MIKLNCKKIMLFVLGVIFGISNMLIACLANDKQELYLHQPDKIYDDVVYYDIPIEKYNDFVIEPEGIEKYGTKYSKFVVPSEEYMFGYIKRNIESLCINDNYMVNSDDTTVVDWGAGTVASYYNLITEDTFNYMKLENISNILKDNGIYEKVSTVALVCVGEFDQYSIFPATIWIKTINNNNYYLVYQGNYNENSHFDIQNIKFMNSTEYINKYSIKTGEFYLNNKYVNLDTKIKFQCNRYLYIPIRDLLESLGSKVTWNNDLKSVSFTCKGNTYTIYNDLLNFKNNIQNQGTLKGYNKVPFIDGKMYIGVGYLEEIAELFDMNINIDYENRSIHLLNKILN